MECFGYVVAQNRFSILSKAIEQYDEMIKGYPEHSPRVNPFLNSPEIFLDRDYAIVIKHEFFKGRGTAKIIML